MLLKDPRVPCIAAPCFEVIPATPSRSLTLAGSLAGPCKHCGSRSDRVQNAMTVVPLPRCSIEKMMVSGGGFPRTVLERLSYIPGLQSRQLLNKLDNIHRKSSA